MLVTLANLLGADRLSKLESSLSSIKIFAIVGFIVLALALISGLMPGKSAVGLGSLAKEELFPSGLAGIAGSMLIVMFTYAGFEVIGLAASESGSPLKTVPKAISYTVISLVVLYVGAISLMLPLIKTQNLDEDTSPMVAALESNGIYWGASVINVVLVTAILSTMLAATFGLGRMLRSSADEGHAPAWVKDKGNTPYKGILLSGAAVLLLFCAAFLLPKYVYRFLVSSGGFSLLFVYVVIIASHYKFRKCNGCPPKGSCQLPGYPFTSWLALVALAAIIFSMPLIPGQGSGLAAGFILLGFYSLIYMVRKRISRT